MMGLTERTKQLSDLLNSTHYTHLGASLKEVEAFNLMYQWLYESKANRKSIYVIGNGGSCGIASHHIVDLINVLEVKALGLSDNNVLTCMGNDYGYASIYARPLDVLTEEEDLLIAISSSGQSENILKACAVFQEKGGRVLTLSGFEQDNPLREMGDLNIWTGQKDYGLVESAHFFILHTLVDGWKAYCNKVSQEELEIVR